MTQWRWDQGRLDYFNFDSLKAIAEVLIQLNGADLGTAGIDPLRESLTAHTGLPFAPVSYTVWRNYARIFKWAMMAARIGNQLLVTDVCRKIADSSDQGWGIDEYMAFVIPHLYYPSPATQAYTINVERVFPFCVLLRYLLAKLMQNGEASITLDEVFSYLVGSDLRGTEPLNEYLVLRPTSRKPQGDELRQIREMLIFLAQSSFFKWNNSTLILDVMNGDGETVEQLMQIATPIIETQNPDADAEIIRLGTVDSHLIQPVAFAAREQQDDLLFTEGKRTRVTHLRVERSPRLRRIFFANMQPPYLCNMCQMNTNLRYPWTDNLLEVHHLLPLASVIRLTSTGTSLSDLVPLCPNCHKAVHTYYRIWLKDHRQVDFLSVQEATSVYNEAKEQMG